MLLSSFFSPFATGSLRVMWMALAVAASVIFSLFFACGSPFAALAAAAALTLSMREALALMFVAWLANQLTGFGLLGYPLEMNAFIWGGVMGVAAMASVVAAKRVAVKSPRLVLVFPAAFVAHQLTIYLAALTPLGGADNFTSDIIGRVMTVDLLGLAVFYLLNRLVAVVNYSTETA